MLDCLAAHAHRLRVLIETLLHRFEHVLVFPSRDSPLGSCRTPGFERAARACRRPVAAQRLGVLLVRITIGQLLARRAAIDILRGETNPSLELSDYQPDHQAKSAPRLVRFLIRAKA